MMKRIVSITIVSALIACVPGPNYYQALAQSRGVEEVPSVGARDVVQAGLSTVEPVLFGDVTNIPNPNIAFINNSQQNLALPQPILQFNSFNLSVPLQQPVISEMNDVVPAFNVPVQVARKVAEGIPAAQGESSVSSRLKSKAGQLWARVINRVNLKTDWGQFFQGSNIFIPDLAASVAGSNAEIRLSGTHLMNDQRGSEHGSGGNNEIENGLAMRGNSEQGQQELDQKDHVLEAMKWQMKYILGQLYPIFPNSILVALGIREESAAINAKDPIKWTHSAITSVLSARDAHLQKMDKLDIQTIAKTRDFIDFLQRDLSPRRWSRNYEMYLVQIKKRIDDLGEIIVSAQTAEDLDMPQTADVQKGTLLWILSGLIAPLLSLTLPAMGLLHVRLLLVVWPGLVFLEFLMGGIHAISADLAGKNHPRLAAGLSSLFISSLFLAGIEFILGGRLLSGMAAMVMVGVWQFLPNGPAAMAIRNPAALSMVCFASISTIVGLFLMSYIGGVFIVSGMIFVGGGIYFARAAARLERTSRGLSRSDEGVEK